MQVVPSQGSFLMAALKSSVFPLCLHISRLTYLGGNTIHFLMPMLEPEVSI